MHVHIVIFNVEGQKSLVAPTKGNLVVSIVPKVRNVSICKMEKQRLEKQFQLAASLVYKFKNSFFPLEIGLSEVIAFHTYRYLTKYEKVPLTYILG